MSMEAPDGFATIEEGSSSLKAVSTDDALIWVRKFGEPHGADLSFWAETVKTDFVANRGYTLLGEDECKDAAGNAGRQYLFEATVGGRPHRYLLAVFVVDGWPDDSILTVEFAAPKDVFEKHLGGVKRAIGTLEP